MHTSATRVPSSTKQASSVNVVGEGKKKRNHSTPTRDRERRELIALRVEYVELSKQLQQARKHFATVRSKQHDKRRANSSSRLISTAPVWRHIARRHLSARREAEKKNRQLKEQIANHLKWYKALQAEMNPTGRKDNHTLPCATATAAALGTVANALLLSEDEKGVTDLELELNDADRANLDMLASGLDSAYLVVDEVLKDQNISEVPLSAVSGSKAALDKERDEFLGIVELRDARIIPFELQLVVDAAWNAWVLWHLGGSCRKSVSAHRSCSYPNVSRPEHTFAVKFRLQTPLHKLPAETKPVFLDLKLVLRRYVEQNRLVLVWRGLSAGENDLDGLFTEETGWVVIEKMPSSRQLNGDELGATAARTSMRSCVRMTPKRADKCAATPAQDRILTNLVVNSYEEDVSNIYREMETQLLRMMRP